MKCDRCARDFNFMDMTPMSKEQLKPELGYGYIPGGGKHLFCDDCLPKVAKRVKETKSCEQTT